MSQGNFLTLNLFESQKISRMLSHHEVQSLFKGIKFCGNFFTNVCKLVALFALSLDLWVINCSQIPCN